MAIMFSLGALVGCIFANVVWLCFKVGRLRIITSDEPGEKPYIFLELSKEVEKVATKKYIVLEVDFRKSVPRE
jgi:hypothetical protein